MARRLILLRHGQTDYNATGRMQGQLDTALSENGRKQAQLTAKRLADWDIRKVISSDLIRASETAEIIAAAHDLEPELDSRLRETDLGLWQAKSHTEIDEKHPGQRAMWRHNPRWAPPEGETRTEVAARSRCVIDELMESFPEWENGTVVAVAHGGTIAALTGALLDIPVDHYPIFSGLGNTSWAQLTARPKYDYHNSESVAPATDFSAQSPERAQWYLDTWNASAIGIPFAPPDSAASRGDGDVSVTYTLNAVEGVQ